MHKDSRWANFVQHGAAKPFTEGAPIAYGEKIKGESMSHPEPATHAAPNGNIIISGSEYLGRAVVPAVNAGTSTLPAGGVLFYTQLSPLAFDGSRIKQLSQMFEQWRFHSLIIEYVPTCPTTTSGGIVGYCTGDIQQNTSLVQGDGGVREAFSRAGSLSLAVWEKGAFHMNKTQQEWYFTALVGEPELTIPGSFQLVANTDFAISTTTQQLGQVFCHYVLEFRVPAVEDTAQFSYSQNNGNLNAALVATAVQNPVNYPAANFGLGAAFQDEGVIGYATVVAVDDTGPGNANWRTWASPTTGDQYTIAPGMVLFFRYAANAGGFYYMFPSLGDAISSAANYGYGPQQAWVWTTASTPASTCGFKFGPIRGVGLGPDG